MDIGTLGNFLMEGVLSRGVALPFLWADGVLGVSGGEVETGRLIREAFSAAESWEKDGGRRRVLGVRPVLVPRKGGIREVMAVIFRWLNFK